MAAKQAKTGEAMTVECDDCEEKPGEFWKRRRKCAHCGGMFCPYCFHHYHRRNHADATTGARRLRAAAGEKS
jgi:hypothetical protein